MEHPSYADHAAILSFKVFPKYLLRESNPWASAARALYGALGDGVRFILVHEAEWESGLGD